MAETIRARELMREEFKQIRIDQTLGEAMAELRAAQAIPGLPNALMVVDGDDRFVGMLTAKLLIQRLVGEELEDVEAADSQLIPAVSRRLLQLIGDAPIPKVACVKPDDRLLTMIRRGLPTRLDFVPVVEDGKPVGLVPATAIFQSAASIALTPEHEGIRFDR